jgi:hypothetical protein
MSAAEELTGGAHFVISDNESGTKGMPMEKQKENIKQPVWGPRIFLLGAILFVGYLILVYGFKITEGNLYTALRYGGIGLAIFGWILWRILKR